MGYGMDWDEDSYTECANGDCGHTGNLEEFMTENQEDGCHQNTTS
jgi:hypothetical protein